MTEAQNQNVAVAGPTEKVRSIMEQTGLSEELVQDFRLATFLAGASILPPTYKGNAANIFIAITTAKLIGIDQFFVMQGTYMFEGRLSWYSKHLQVIFKKILGAVIDWEYDRTDNANMSCRAIATVHSKETKGIWISQQMARDSNWKSLLWKSAPELMLSYRSAAWLINMRFPEILGGIPIDYDLEDASPATSLSVSSGSEDSTGHHGLSQRLKDRKNAASILKTVAAE